MKKDAAIFKSIELESDNETEGDDSTWTIPLPATLRSPAHRHSRRSTPLTPLLQPTRRHHHIGDNDDDDDDDDACDDRGLTSTGRLFGDSIFVSPRRNEKHNLSTETNNDVSSKSMRPEGMTGWFFGFMYEEVYNESFDFDEEEDVNVTTSVWNHLNLPLFATYALTTAAAALPVILIPVIGQDFLSDESEKSAFSSRAASSAVLGIACGKFFNAQVGDFLGARRTSSLYSILLAIALLSLSISRNASSAITACFYVEFFQSVQWPCIIIILGTHYRPPHQTQYESGIFLTSIASRFGALLGIPIFSILLRQSNWRIAGLVGAWVALIGSSIMYLYVADSPTRTNQPQNPLHPTLLQQMSNLDTFKYPKRSLIVYIKIIHSIIINNMLPSFRHVLSSGTFWVVALAHTGSSMVRTAERILGTYFYDTSFGYLSESKAAGLAIFLSLGTVLGLAIAGNLFAQRKGRQRKWLVTRLYIITIIACYSLAILAIPRLRYFVDSPELIIFFQVVSSLCMGFGIAVMYSLIPGLVGSAFGRHRGSYIAYTDGVAFGISSIVWKVVANAVGNGNPDGGGWAYGWAAVALLIVLCAILMVEFMEHYFVRGHGKHNGTYETIILA